MGRLAHAEDTSRAAVMASGKGASSQGDEEARDELEGSSGGGCTLQTFKGSAEELKGLFDLVRADD